MAKKPNLFIAGFPKSGTSALHYFLGQHPDIYMSAVKEPDYFKEDYMPHKNIETEKRYLELFKDGENAKICGEASTQYIVSKDAAREIFEFNPEAKIIIMVREPIDFLYSLYSHIMRSSFDFMSFDIFMEQRIKKSRWINYVKHISKFYEVFDNNHIKVIIYDDFKNEIIRIYKEVLQFLDVNPDFKPKFEILNPNKSVKFAKVKRLVDRMLFDRYFRIIKKIEDFSITKNVHTILRKIYHKLFFKLDQRPPLGPDLIKQLKRKYKKDVEELSEFTRKDLVTLWGYDKV